MFLFDLGKMCVEIVFDAAEHLIIAKATRFKHDMANLIVDHGRPYGNAG